MEENKAAVIVREEDNFRRRIREALEILCQSPTLNRDRGFELPALYGNVLTRGLGHPSSRDKRFPPHSLETDSVMASKVGDRGNIDPASVFLIMSSTEPENNIFTRNF